MENTYTNIVDNIIIEYLNLKKSYNSKSINSTKQVLSDFMKIENFNIKNELVQLKLVIDNIENLFQKVKEKNKLTSSDFNILKLFRINEPKHSFLLHNFLYPYGNHGQGHLFLNIFLDLLGIERKANNELWTVTAEKGRIDLLIKRRNPHSVILIENKSNYAKDQDNQLYRYWHQEIYLPIKRKHGFYDMKNEPKSKYYQLLYLTPHSSKKPSENSLTKPLNWDWDLDLPEKLPMKITYVSFSKFIIEWLETSLKSIHKDNHRLKEYVKQYIEYWTIN